MATRTHSNHSFSQFLRSLLPYALLIAAAAVCYMSLAHLLGYYNDDWYLIYAGTSQGVAKFHDVFAIDRPFRGYFVGWMFQLFGVNPWLYSLGAFLMRCLSALGMLWIMRIAWPEERKTGFIAALLFVVYPGFLDQPNAIDYQTHLWSFALAIISIGCTLQAITSIKIQVKALFIALSLATQLLSLMLMEYYIGLEGLRFILIIYLTWKQNKVKFTKLAWRTFIRYLPSFIVALGFLIWLTQVFQAQRQAVNVENIVGSVIESPALRLIWMVVYVFKDLLNVIFIAWAEPLYQFGFAERLKYLLPEIGLALLAGGFAWLAIHNFRDASNGENQRTSSVTTARDMVIIGLLAAIIALIPVNFSNRQVIFNGFSRFSLPPSTGAILILAGALVAIGKSQVKTWLVVSLVILAALAHIGNASNYAEQWKIVRSFWWQVTWRAPQIAPGTVIMADYADTGIAEDYFIWGPANLIYYPKLPYQKSTVLKLNAATLASNNLEAAVMQAKQDYERRGFLSNIDFSNLLVLSMPSETNCVQAIDGNSLELSSETRSEIMIIAANSQISRVLSNETITRPPEYIFGKEPEHGWCYYYEKASLARQEGEWDKIVSLGEEAARHNQRPYDPIEWMPFAEAYAYTGQNEAAHNLATIIKDDPYYGYQACQGVLSDPYGLGGRFPDGHRLLFNEFCQSGSE